MKNKVGMIMFQFEYLNKQKMPNQNLFQLQLEEFITRLDRKYNYGIEIRNPNYLNKNWFSFLKNHDISPIFLQGYYMPHIYDIYKKNDTSVNNKAVIRLHGFDRKGIEDRTKKIWSSIVDPQDKDLIQIIEMIKYFYLEKAPNNADLQIYFDRIEEDKLLFHIYGLKKNEVGQTAIGSAFYNKLEPDIKKMTATKPFDSFLQPPYVSIRKIYLEE